MYKILDLIGVSERSQSSQMAIILIFIKPSIWFIIFKEKYNPGIRKPFLDFRGTYCFSNQFLNTDYRKKSCESFCILHQRCDTAKRKDRLKSMDRK